MTVKGRPLRDRTSELGMRVYEILKEAYPKTVSMSELTRRLGMKQTMVRMALDGATMLCRIYEEEERNKREGSRYGLLEVGLIDWGNKCEG